MGVKLILCVFTKIKNKTKEKQIKDDGKYQRASHEVEASACVGKLRHVVKCISNCGS